MTADHVHKHGDDAGEQSSTDDVKSNQWQADVPLWSPTNG